MWPQLGLPWGCGGSGGSWADEGRPGADLKHIPYGGVWTEACLCVCDCVVDAVVHLALLRESHLSLRYYGSSCLELADRGVHCWCVCWVVISKLLAKVSPSCAVRGRGAWLCVCGLVVCVRNLCHHVELYILGVVTAGWGH